MGNVATSTRNLFLRATYVDNPEDQMMTKSTPKNSPYIDGFVFPISPSNLEKYRAVADVVAAIYREHGAIDYVEFIGEDMQREGTRSFLEMTGVENGETVVFGWIVYESREERDRVNRLVEADARMGDLVAPLMDPSNPVFSPDRMAFGGFKPLVRSARQ